MEPVPNVLLVSFQLEVQTPVLPVLLDSSPMPVRQAALLAQLIALTALMLLHALHATLALASAMELAFSVLIMNSQQVELTHVQIVLQERSLPQELPPAPPVPQAALPAMMPPTAQLATLALA